MISRILEIALGSISVAYPFLVFFGLRVLPARDIALGLALLLGLRLSVARAYGKPDSLPILASAAVLFFLILRSPAIGLRAYPVILSSVFGAVFAYSLISPPTVVERIARLRHPNLPAEANSYLRKVTVAWVVFFVVNAIVSATTTLSGNLRVWTIYNGLISYLAMGTLFGIELLIRRRVQRRFLRGAG
ncbi:MAG TPA: hypothetical protein VMT61_18075 [Candidatus Binataceae bacterium]|nr:hypothetical protein [Candidatus Binataceae bacterium]